MEKQEFINEATKGGPGLNGYIYKSTLYCIDCGEAICAEIADSIAPQLSDGIDWTSDSNSWSIFTDSEQVPQPEFFGESECREYCSCGEEIDISVV